MVYCILLSGLPAAGKSTMARRISEATGIPIVSKDDIKEILFDTIGFKSREEKLRLGTASMMLMYYTAEKIMAMGSSIILDNNFENSSRDGLETLLTNCQATPVTVHMDGDPEVIYHRFIERDRSPDRHRGHITNVCYPEDYPVTEPVIEMEMFVNRYTDRGMRDFVMGKTIDVDATDLDSIDYDEVIRSVQRILQS